MSVLNDMSTRLAYSRKTGSETSNDISHFLSADVTDPVSVIDMCVLVYYNKSECALLYLTEASKITSDFNYTNLFVLLLTLLRSNSKKIENKIIKFVKLTSLENFHF